VLLVRQGVHYSPDYRAEYFTTPASRANLQARSAAVMFMQVVAGAEPFRAVGTVNTLFAGFTSVYGLEGINGPDALKNGAYAALMAPCHLTRPDDWRMVLAPAMMPRLQPVLDLLNVRFCATEPGAPAPGGTYAHVADLDLTIYASPTVWPRAFFTDTVIPYRQPDEVIALAGDAAGRPFAAMTADDAAAQDALRRLPADFARRQVVPAADFRLTNNTTAFTIDAPAAGVIVLHEAYLPDDFRVTVNGEPAACFRVNHAFKGVAVTAAGRYRVVFTYRPRHWALALGLAGAGLASLLAGGIVVRSAGSKPAPPSTAAI
jgi:hypothetical protein